MNPHSNNPSIVNKSAIRNPQSSIRNCVIRWSRGAFPARNAALRIRTRGQSGPALETSLACATTFSSRDGKRRVERAVPGDFARAWPRRS
jgi:hypothetical protein